jgi:hypothetical protein
VPFLGLSGQQSEDLILGHNHVRLLHLIPQSSDWLAAFHLELLQNISPENLVPDGFIIILLLLL